MGNHETGNLLMRKLLLLAFFLLAIACQRLLAATMPTNAVSLAQILRASQNDQRVFELCGQVISRMTNNYPLAIVRDETGCIPVAFNRGLHLRLTTGDRIRSAAGSPNWAAATGRCSSTNWPYSPTIR